MARTYPEITDHLREWVSRQTMFFVATAPLAGDGHVNVSPKGPIGSRRVLDGRRVAYLDMEGSGVETIAHLRENGRIVVMLCAFDGPPRIVRFHGQGEAVMPEDSRFAALLKEGGFEDPSLPEARRSIVVVDVTRVSDSCGYGVPLLSFGGLREHHALHTQKKLRTLGPDGYAQHRQAGNASSVDGLPGLGP